MTAPGKALQRTDSTVIPKSGLGSAVPDSPFTNLTLQRLKQILASTLPTEYKINKKFMDGDHWQDGEGWVGPMPPYDAPGAENVKSQIERGFLSKNVIREIVDRHTNGVLGRSPIWSFTGREIDNPEGNLSEQQKNLIAEVEQPLIRWWDKVKAHECLKSALRTMLFSERAVFRVYVPMGKTMELENGEVGIPIANSLAEALSYIFPDVPNADETCVFNDPLTEQKLGIFLYHPIDVTTGMAKAVEALELTYLVPMDEDGGIAPTADVGIDEFTIVRTLDAGTDSIVPMELGSRLTMYQIERPLFVTKQLQEQQKALNLALSMIPRNIVSGGFLERVILNAEMPGEYTYDDKGKVTGFIPAKFYAGAGSTNALRGIAVEQPDGKTTLTTPDVKWREPSPVKPAIDAAQAIYLAMLEEARQAHIILSGEALVSGKSREQARSDFDTSLYESKIPCDNMGQWLLDTVLAYAEFLMGQPGLYTTQLKSVFQCHTFTGPVNWEERKQNDASIGFTLSQQRAMEMNGILDVDSEIARIKQEQNGLIDHVSKQALAFKQMTEGGMSTEVAGTLVGFSPEIISKLVAIDQTALDQQKAVIDAANAKAEGNQNAKANPNPKEKADPNPDAPSKTLAKEPGAV